MLHQRSASIRFPSDIKQLLLSPTSVSSVCGGNEQTDTIAVLTIPLYHCSSKYSSTELFWGTNLLFEKLFQNLLPETPVTNWVRYIYIIIWDFIQAKPVLGRTALSQVSFATISTFWFLTILRWVMFTAGYRLQRSHGPGSMDSIYSLFSHSFVICDSGLAMPRLTWRLQLSKSCVFFHTTVLPCCGVFSIV